MLTQKEQIQKLPKSKGKEVALQVVEAIWKLHRDSQQALDRSDYLDRYGNVLESHAERYLRVQSIIFSLSQKTQDRVLTILNQSVMT